MAQESDKDARKKRFSKLEKEKVVVLEGGFKAPLLYVEKKLTAGDSRVKRPVYESQIPWGYEGI
jgi:hypothetical protein